MAWTDRARPVAEWLGNLNMLKVQLLGFWFGAFKRDGTFVAKLSGAVEVSGR